MPIHSPNDAGARRKLYEHFPDLDNVRELVEPGVQVLVFGPGEVIFNRGGRVDRLFFLINGQIAEQGLRRDADGARQPRLVRRLEPTHFRPLPVLALYDYLYDQPHSTHAVAHSPCQLLVMASSVFEKILFHRPELPYTLAPLGLADRLRTIPLFSRLDRIELHYVAEAAEPTTRDADQVLFDRPHNDLFLVDQGQVLVEQHDGRSLLVGNGGAVGFAELDRQSRTVAASDLIRIDRQALADLAPLDYEREGRALRQAVQRTLTQLYVFSDPAFAPDQLLRLAGFMSHYVLPVNTILAQQGELTDSMWVLLTGGRVLLHALDERGQALLTTPAQGLISFSETALLAPAPIDSTLEAEAGGQWLRLQRDDFQAFLATAPDHLAGKLRLREENQPDQSWRRTGERFPWLQDGERVIWPSRRHWLVLIRKTWLALLVLTVVLMSYAGVALLPDWQIGVGIGLAGVGALGLAYFLWGLYDYWNDYIVVTNRRLVRQEHVLLQSRRQQDTGLEQIRNVDIAKSLSGQLLDFGVLRVQTAGSQGTIGFDFVPEVERVQRALIAQMNRRRHYREAASKLDIQRHLEGRLGRRLELPERVLATRAAAIEPANLPNWLMRLGVSRRRHSRYEHERIIWRKHWMVLVARLFWPVLTFCGLLLLLFGELIFLPAVVSVLLTGPLSFVLGLLGLLNLGMILWRIADWHNDTYEVTRDEVADVERLPLFFDEQRRTARLVAIDNIRSEVPTPLNYLFNFGNVRLETAATQGEFTFDAVADPAGVAAEIRRRIEAARRREEQERARQRTRELTDWFELYDRLKNTGVGSQDQQVKK